MERLVLVVGQAQKGKTTLAVKKLLSLSVPRLLILDPVRSKPFTSLIQKGAHVFETWDELAKFLATANGKWIAILRSMNQDDYRKALENARYLRHATLLADEGLHYVSDPLTKECFTKVARANAHFGDGLGVPLWVTAQRPMDIPPDVRSQATSFISFRQDEPADLTFLAQRCTSAFADKVSKLEGHNWLAFPSTSDNGENDSG